jgi:hypothetical protein
MSDAPRIHLDANELATAIRIELALGTVVQPTPLPPALQPDDAETRALIAEAARQVLDDLRRYRQWDRGNPYGWRPWHPGYAHARFLARVTPYALGFGVLFTVIGVLGLMGVFG